MYESIYNIDLDRFEAQVLPIKRRTTKMLQWMMCLIFPIVELHTQFLRFRDKTTYELEHTSQVFSMEDAMNDAFDNALRRIYIVDGEYTSPVLFYGRADVKPVRFYDRADDSPVLFYDRKLKLDVDFIVMLPQALNLSAAETLRLQALIDFYRLPDKTYTLNYE